MYGWCKPRKEFVSRLIGGQTYQFKESEICEFDDLGDLYNVSSNDYNYDVDFSREVFYKKFRVIHREVEYFEKEYIVDIYTYKKINSADERSYLVYSIYLEEYYEWLNRLYDFKENLAFQELIDFEDKKRMLDSEISKKIYADFKKYYNEAKIYDENLKVRIPLKRNSQSAIAERLSAPNGKFISN